jgi:hypothetical protein
MFLLYAKWGMAGPPSANDGQENQHKRWADFLPPAHAASIGAVILRRIEFTTQSILMVAAQ